MYKIFAFVTFNEHTDEEHCLDNNDKDLFFDDLHAAVKKYVELINDKDSLDFSCMDRLVETDYKEEASCTYQGIIQLKECLSSEYCSEETLYYSSTRERNPLTKSILTYKPVEFGTVCSRYEKTSCGMNLNVMSRC